MLMLALSKSERGHQHYVFPTFVGITESNNIKKYSYSLLGLFSLERLL